MNRKKTAVTALVLVISVVSAVGYISTEAAVPDTCSEIVGRDQSPPRIYKNGNRISVEKTNLEENGQEGVKKESSLSEESMSLGMRHKPGKHRSGHTEKDIVYDPPTVEELQQDVVAAEAQKAASSSKSSSSSSKKESSSKMKKKSSSGDYVLH